MKILFIAPLPPPVHGSAMVSQYIKDSRLVNEQHDCDFVNLSTSRRMDEIGKGGIKKLLRFVGAYLTLLWKLLTRRYDLCYLAITCHGVGFLKDAPFVLLCKFFRRKVMIHQHNKGMSRYVDRWPYRWLLPLVYRNTRVMLLSWHLYPDISRVVKREQVVVCANGVPPLQVIGEGLKVKGQQPKANSQAPDTQQEFSHADYTDYTESISCQCASQRAKCRFTCDFSASAASEDINQQNLDTITQNTHCFARVGHPEGNAKHYTLDTQQELSHAEYTESTEKASLAENASQQDLNTMTQNLQVASPLLASGAHTHPDGVTAMSESPLFGRGRGEASHLLFLSNLIPSKGVYVLLDACRVLKERGLAFICDFVGGETKEISAEVFREAVAKRGLEEHVTYHGPKYGEEKHRFFMNADVFVQPTFDDCFPLTLVEAMQYRLPIASTDVGAIPDMVEHGVNGFVCKQQDVDSLVNALERLITDPALRQQMGEAGYQRYCEEFTLEAFEKRFAAELLD